MPRLSKLSKRLRPILTRWTTFSHWRSQIVFWTGALLIGLAAVLLARLADQAQSMFLFARTRLFWLPLIVTPLGFAASSFAARRWFKGSQGSGIPQVIAAAEIVHSHPKGLERLVSLRLVAGKAVLLILGLLCGASIGREGPTVQIGAALMRVTGRIGRIGSEQALLLAGGAAGVAAAFNTPLAGIVFAIEELGKSFEQRTSGTVIFTVMLAGVASLALLGDYTYFGRNTTTLSGWIDVAAVAICGIGGGLCGGLFARMLILGTRHLRLLFGGLFSRRPVAFAASCGVLVAVIGTLTGGSIFGTGYPEAKALLAGHAEITPGYGLLKIFSTLLSCVSGIPGGLFAPSLAAGAGLGADMHYAVPMIPLATMALLGMVGYFSGVVQSPLTAFVIVLEMTNDHDMVIPLMATSLLAYSVSKLVCAKPLYHSLSHGFLRQERKARRAQQAEDEMAGDDAIPGGA